MRIVPFASSRPMTIGVELELQLINSHTYDLANRSQELLKDISKFALKDLIKPEITQSMIELNSSVHDNLPSLQDELYTVQQFLLDIADKYQLRISGGGTHPFQKWASQKIFPLPRYKNLAKQYRYLTQRATVFGQHVHIGCETGDDAIYLTHALSQYAPHFLALSASSPFYQGIDTGYHSVRSTSTLFHAMPMSGITPYFLNWQEFSNYFFLMKRAGIIRSMKDCYWDIRPKPEFGTVEVRICDTPLSLKKTLLIAAYIQTLAHDILTKRNFSFPKDLYYLYHFNRFQASRYGFEGEYIQTGSLHHTTIKHDMLKVLAEITDSGKALNNTSYLTSIRNMVENNLNDACAIREIFYQEKSMPIVVREQCNIWAEK